VGGGEVMQMEIIENKINKAKDSYHQLLFLVGFDSPEMTEYLKTLSRKLNYPYINLSKELSSRLLGYSIKQRKYQSVNEVEMLLREQDVPVLLVDKIEILFAPDLNLEPIELFRRLSRNRTLVIAWPGEYQNGSLSYAVPEHAEYRDFGKVDAIFLEG
jgi:hypothetical protein